MADKIVILEDSEGNNIYPISRGLATNSVDTNAIQNGAVTSDKMDWATIADVVTNSNGTAIKFGNGLMICTVAKEVTTDATYGVTRWDYPVAFISAPVVCSNTTRTSGYKNALARVDGTNPTYTQFAWINAADNSQLKSETIPAFSAFAIGNWK